MRTFFDGVTWMVAIELYGRDRDKGMMGKDMCE